MSSSKQREIVLVVALVTLGAAMRLALFNGLFGHDDWTYLFYIRSFLNGQTYELLHTTVGLRYLVWLPIAAGFKLWGASYAGAFLPGFLSGLASIPLTYLCIRKLGGTVATAAAGGLLLLFNPIDWTVATTIRGDIEMSFYGGVLLLLLLCFREANGRRRLLLGVAAGCVWGLSALAKEWGFVFAWGLFAIALFDAISERRIPWEYALVGFGFFAVLALDTVALHAATGEWLARIRISVLTYRHTVAEGADAADRSGAFSYLPSILAGLRTRVTEFGRFSNGYPYFGIYMWPLLVALPLCLWRRGPARPVAWFVTGLLLWIEFGSMSWSSYVPYHKEPRYLALMSVPLAVLMAMAGTYLWNSRSRLLRVTLAIVALAIAVVTTRVVRDEHREYSRGRDFMPDLVAWLDHHHEARLWAVFSLQNEIDLRCGYRFSDPVHGHAGASGYGSVMDMNFWDHYHLDGDYVLVNESWNTLRDQFPAIRMRHFDFNRVARLRGPSSTALIYQVFDRSATRQGADELSDEEPVEASQAWGVLHYDSNVTGLPLLLAGIHYRTGLGTHAQSRLVYRLDGKYAVFASDVGLDDNVIGGLGSVIFEVWVDDRRVYQSKIMRGGDKPESVRIDLTGAKVLRLVVDDAGDGNHDDHADWAGARLIKSPPEKKP